MQRVVRQSRGIHTVCADLKCRKSLAGSPCPCNLETMQAENRFGKIRSAGQLKGGLLLRLFVTAVCMIGSITFSAAESLDHPYLGTEDLKSETCLKCHPTKNKGKFVHPAVAMGCLGCHQAVSANDKTTISLMAAGGELCAKCHESSKDPVQHGPYKAGQCLLCHNPHAGEYQAQMRAPVNTLCLSCHMLNQPGAKANVDDKTVSLPGGQTYDLASWERAPKIGEDHGANNISHLPSGTATSKKPEKPGSDLDCLSCHDPHASQTNHLLRR